MEKEWIHTIVAKCCVTLLDSFQEFTPYTNETIAVGDVLWCTMPLTKKALKKVPYGHRVRPYVITSVTKETCQGYACSTKLNQIKSLRQYQYFIEKEKYQLKKSSYVDVSKTWQIPYANVHAFFYHLHDEDVKKMLQLSKKTGIAKTDTLAGSILKKNHQYFIIWNQQPDCYHLLGLSKVSSKIRDETYTLDIKGTLYDINFSQHKEVKSITGYVLQNRLSENIFSEMKEHEEEWKTAHQKQVAFTMLEQMCAKYPIGTRFRHVKTDQYFVYLYQIEKQAYGFYENEQIENQFVFRKVSLHNMRKSPKRHDDRSLLQMLCRMQVPLPHSYIMKLIKYRVIEEITKYQ